MKLLFEGLDLAGKSTVTTMMHQRLGSGWELRKNSMVPVGTNTIYDLALRLRLARAIDNVNLGFLYLAALRHDIELFEKEPVGQQADIVQDSTIMLRSLAYHKASGNHELVGLFESLLDRMPRYDILFLCTITHEERLRRLQLRRKENIGEEDLLVVKDPELFYQTESYLFEYARRHFHTVEIDTGGNIKFDQARKQALIAEIMSHIPANGN